MADIQDLIDSLAKADPSQLKALQGIFNPVPAQDALRQAKGQWIVDARAMWAEAERLFADVSGGIEAGDLTVLIPAVGDTLAVLAVAAKVDVSASIAPSPAVQVLVDTLSVKAAPAVAVAVEAVAP